MEEKQIRASTKRRYALVAKAVRERLGKMPVMMVYLEVAQEMGLAEETVRRIIWKKKNANLYEICFMMKKSTPIAIFMSNKKTPEGGFPPGDVMLF